MKKLIISTAVSLAVVGALSASETLNIHPGWQLLGSSNAVEDVASAFGNSNIKTVWVFDDVTQSWRAYSPDSNIMQLINDNEFIAPLDSIAPNSGFWVNFVGYETVTLGNDSSGDLPPIDSDKSFHFADDFVGVQVSTLAGKTFKIVDLGAKEDGVVSYIPLTFDANGTTQLVDEAVSCNDQEQEVTSKTITFEVINDALRISNGVEFREYMILAQDETGIVFGALDVGTKDYIEWKGDDLPPVLVFLNENATESPVDMGSVLPYKAYHSWSKNSYTVYEQNGTIDEFYDGYESDDKDSFEIVDGKISATRTDEWENEGFEDNYVLQTIYTVEHYDINRVDFSGYHYSTTVDYKDENGSWSDFNLTANPDVDTWQELFAQTNWTLWGTKYYEDNGTTEYGEQFSISEDGKTLIIESCWGEHNQSIESGKIYDTWSGVWVGVESSTPIYEMETTTSDGLPSLKISNEKREPLNFLPPYVRKAILKK